MDEPLPRIVRLFVIPASGVLLTLFFLVRGFPYDRLSERISSEAARATNLEIAIAEIEPSLSLQGPGFTARGLRGTSPHGDTLVVESLFLRPSWSLSWLSGSPAVHTEAEAAFGSAQGLLTLDGDETAWKGSLRGFDLAQLPVGAQWGTTEMEGRVDADLDLRLTAAGPVGTVHFEGLDGTALLPSLLLPVPYQSVAGDIRLQEDGTMVVESFALEGERMSGTVTGHIGPGSNFWTAPMDLDVRLSVEKSMIGPLRTLGARVSRSGAVRMRLGGTPSQPEVLR